MKIFKKRSILSALLIIIIPILLLVGIINKSQNNKKITINPQNIEEDIKSNKNINIALFGLDRRKDNEPARSDSIMIASIDLKTKEINLVSLLRDTLVDIKGHKKDKLNHAYAYGGAELALDTINTNFDLDIDKYLAVDFYSLAKVIDIIGGVDIDLKDYEVEEINKNLVELNKIEELDKKADYIKGSGIKTLNGRQAVAYSRIRKKGNGDYERTERQRNVLKGLLKKYEEKEKDEQFEMAMAIIGKVSTNIPINDIKKLKSIINENINFKVSQNMIPYEGSFKSTTYKGMWCIEANMEDNIRVLHKYIK